MAPSSTVRYSYADLAAATAATTAHRTALPQVAPSLGIHDHERDAASLAGRRAQEENAA